MSGAEGGLPAARPPRRGVLLAALAGLPVLLALVALGTWQLQRLAWKTALLARLDAAAAAPAVPLETLASPPEPYAKVSVRGRFLHDRAALLGAEVRGGRLGARLLTPLQRAAGGPALLVDRGWVPLAPDGAAPDPAARIARPEGEATVVGYVRPAQARDWLAAADDPARRRFFTFDPAAIGAVLGLPAVEPFGVVALADGAGGETLPIPAAALPRPDNPHLGYAVTWYGLALALVLVFLAWARRKESRAA
ncbi:SURF1 family protein [Caldovatus aquaticus]|uniref:SURF1 family protein n=1 Tax=Caldovatus aquaticus TaxID=2865671 RepID=UPI0034E2726F